MKAKTISCFLGFLAFLSTINVNAQSWQWAKHFGSMSSDYGLSVCTDSFGNCYFTGEMNGPAVAYLGNDSFQVSGISDIYFGKMDNNGNFIWSKRAGGYNGIYNDNESGTDIAYESSTNSIVVTGKFDSQDDSISNCAVGSGHHFFISKLDTGGNCQWATPGYGYTGLITAFDNSGYIYAICSFASSINAIGTYTFGKGNYIIKFNSSTGACLWIKKIAEFDQFPSVAGIAYYNNKIYIKGELYSDSMFIDTIKVAGYPMQHTYISEFDTSGNVQWLKTISSTQYTASSGLALDGSGNIYITGVFKDTAFFDNVMLTNGNKADWFLGKYNNSGSLIWVRQAHNSDSIYTGGNVSLDGNGTIYVANNFAGSAVLGTDTIRSSALPEFFIARYNSNGDYLGVKHVANRSDLAGQTILPDNAGGCYVNGAFGGFYINGAFNDSINFDNIKLKAYDNGEDVFIAKINSNFTAVIDPSPRAGSDQLFIYANPTTGKCNITIPEEFKHEKNLVLSVFDNSGKVVQKSTLEMNEEKIRLNLEALATGIYNVTLTNGKKSYSGRIVVE